MIIRSGLFDDTAGVGHGFSTRVHGDMRDPSRRAAFTALLGLDANALAKPKQVHGSDIGEDGDGMVSQSGPLCIITADCTPILAADPKRGIVGAAHAGWKGTVLGVANSLIASMTALGAVVDDIVAVIGPRIDMSSYDVPKERADMFRERFFADLRVVRQAEDGRWHVDIGEANRIALMEAGVKRDRIDILPYSTARQKDLFYSYRTGDQSSYGEMVAVIGIRRNP